MKWYQDYRRELELKLLASVLVENTYLLLKGILGKQNFSSDRNMNRQWIWSAYEALYPDNLILHGNVRKAILDQHQIDYQKQLQEVMSHSYGGNCLHDALILVELSIRELIVSRLQAVELKATENGRLEQAGIYKQVRDHFLDHVDDLFDSLKDAISYLQSYHCQDGVVELQDLQDSFMIKIDTIKAYDRFDQLGRNLESAISNPTLGLYVKNGKAVRLLLKIAHKVSSADRLPSDVFDKINSLGYALGTKTI